MPEAGRSQSAVRLIELLQQPVLFCLSGQHFSMNTQILFVVQKMPHRVGHSAESDLDGGPVRDPFGNQ